MLIAKPKYPKGWNLKTYLAEQKTRVENRLAELPLARGKLTRAREALRYALDAPGKRFRPLLTLATADIYQRGHLDEVLDCAAAVECVHTASLLFDDLPCMDDAGLRRGRQTAHRVFGEDQAILAGLSLIGEANQLVLRAFSSRKSRMQKKLECLAILNASYSVEGLSGGQSDDLLNKSALTLEEVEYIHAKKTGTLFIACMEMGAVLGNASAQERRWLRSYAKNLGLAFQIQDDLLDLESSAITGKDQYLDKEKTTFVKLVGAEKCRELYLTLVNVALKNLEPFGDAAFHLLELTRMIQQRRH